MSKLDSFLLLKLDGNEICEEGVARVTSILAKSGKTLGGSARGDRLYVDFYFCSQNCVALNDFLCFVTLCESCYMSFTFYIVFCSRDG